MKDLARNDESGHNSGAFRHLGNNNNMLNDAHNRPRQEPLRSEPLNQSSNRSSTPGRYGNGAFRHAGQPSQSKAAQNGLDQLGKASGLTGKGGKLNQFGQGVKDVGKRTPDLDRVPTNFRNARAAMPNMGATSGPGQDGDMPGLSSKKHNGPQSGLPDPDKDPSRQRQPGNGDKQPNNNGMENPLGKYGKYTPAALQKLGGKAGKAYGKTMSGFISGVQKVGKQFGLHLGKAASVKIVHWLMISAVGAGLFGIGWAYNNDDQVLDGGPVCSTQNTGDQSYDGTESGGKQGGDWSHPGTTQYKNAKAVAEKLKSMGFSGVAIAGIMGNMAQESGFKTQVLNGSGDGGKGLMQWTGDRRTELESFAKEKGMDSGSLKLQLLMMERDLKKKNFWVSAYKPISPKILNHSSSPADAAMRFYLSQFEAGGGHATDPDGSGKNRKAYAQQAYATFKLSGIKGDDSKVTSLLGGGNASLANANSATAESLNNANCNKNGNGPVVAGAWTWPFSNFNPDKDVSGAQLFGHAPGGGFRPNGFHDGIDIGTATHSGDMHAIHGGVVKKIDCQGHSQSDLGYYILIESPDGYTEVYQEFAFSMADGKRVSKVKVGDHVKTGQTIARLDPTTPNCTHVHIGVYKGKASDWQTAIHHSFDKWHWQNPIEIIKKSKGK